MSRPNFIPNIPSEWATCPIYAKGVLLPKKDPSDPDTFAGGKSPLGKAWKLNLNVEDSALMIQNEPDKFKAIGVFTGVKSDGLVIFDVDRNLGAIQKKWGSDLDNAPKIISPKKNAAKFLFKVPEENWIEVESLSHTAAGNEGWEVLWGGQGVIAGEYYTGEGNYELDGELADVPVVPDWLLARMKEQYRNKNTETDVKYVDNRWSKRSKEEKVAIISSCLSVIGYQGPDQADYWWEIGAMINNELPGEEGLNLWREWSKNDPDYKYAWENEADPCSDRWYQAWRHDGTKLNMGNLINLADGTDPARKRLKENGLDKLVEEVSAIPLRFKEEIPDGKDVIKSYVEIDNDPVNENPAYRNQALHKLAIESKRRSAAEIEELAESYELFERTKGHKPKNIGELDDTPFDYTIPGLLPKPWTLLLHADGGTGKTAMCMTIAKHIADGIPFEVYGDKVSVPVGKVLWLNGDQNERVLRRQFEQVNIKNTRNVHIIGEWDMQWYSRFEKLQKKNKYDLIIIDSLDGCNNSNPYNENAREYALPLKKLVRRNGNENGFHPCSLIIIHHNNKDGSERGTTAIKNSVDESWNMRKMENAETIELNVGANTRSVKVKKSRDDRADMKMLFNLQLDYTYTISSYPETENAITFDCPNVYSQSLLRVMRANIKPYTISDLVENEEVGGVHRKTAIKHGIKRLKDQKLVEEVNGPKITGKRGGRPAKYYQAVSVPVKKDTSPNSQLKSVSKPPNLDIGTGFNDNQDCQNPPLVKTSQEEIGFGSEKVLSKPNIIENPSTGTGEGFGRNSGTQGNNEWDMWKIDKKDTVRMYNEDSVIDV